MLGAYGPRAQIKMETCMGVPSQRRTWDYTPGEIKERSKTGYRKQKGIIKERGRHDCSAGTNQAACITSSEGEWLFSEQERPVKWMSYAWIPSEKNRGLQQEFRGDSETIVE